MTKKTTSTPVRRTSIVWAVRHWWALHGAPAERRGLPVPVMAMGKRRPDGTFARITVPATVTRDGPDAILHYMEQRLEAARQAAGLPASEARKLVTSEREETVRPPSTGERKRRPSDIKRAEKRAAAAKVRQADKERKAAERAAYRAEMDALEHRAARARAHVVYIPRPVARETWNQYQSRVAKALPGDIRMSAEIQRAVGKVWRGSS